MEIWEVTTECGESLMGLDDKDELTADSEYTNTSRVLYKGPCEVCSVMLAADGANGDCQVYDGTNAHGKQIAHIEALSGTTFSWLHPHKVQFHNGIYIAVNAATSKVTATFHTESRKDYI